MICVQPRFAVCSSCHLWHIPWFMRSRNRAAFGILLNRNFHLILRLKISRTRLLFILFDRLRLQLTWQIFFTAPHWWPYLLWRKYWLNRFAARRWVVKTAGKKYNPNANKKGMRKYYQTHLSLLNSYLSSNCLMVRLQYLNDTSYKPTSTHCGPIFSPVLENRAAANSLTSLGDSNNSSSSGFLLCKKHSFMHAHCKQRSNVFVAESFIL